MPPKNPNRITKWNAPGESGNLKAIIIFNLCNLSHLPVRKTFGSQLLAIFKNCSLFSRFISNSILWLKFCNKGKCKCMYVCSSKLGKCLSPLSEEQTPTVPSPSPMKGFAGSAQTHHQKRAQVPWLSGSVGCRVIPYIKRLWVQFLVKEHTWVAGFIPG